MGKKIRVSRQKAQAKRNTEPVYQPCCGAPKNGHYGDCKRGGKK